MQTAGAIFSRCRTWRYRLTRVWELDRPQLNVILLNPSTADEQRDDPTIRRVISFARREGFGRLEVTNLFAFRATNPDHLRWASNPIGPQNDDELRQAAEAADAVWVAWGVHGAYRERGAQVLRLLEGVHLWCFGRTKGGEPRHPLYLGNATELVRFA